MQWKTLPIIAFDTETTGLNAHAGDRVIEFAAVEITLDASGDIQSVTRNEMMFQPGIPIPREVVKLTGITDEDVASAPEFADRAQEVWGLLHNRMIVAHNLPFDRGFLSMEFRRIGLDWPAPLAELDTYDLSVRFFSEARGHKLSVVAERLGVRLEGAHRASNDAEATGRAFLKIAGQRGAPDSLQELLDWADALGHPPDGGAILLNDVGIPVFGTGTHAGEPIEHHPTYLQWMGLALERRDGAWHPRFSEAVRDWAARYLRIRTSGRARQNAKSFGPGDWTIESQALPLARAPLR